jgi:hypothetical protein
MKELADYSEEFRLDLKLQDFSKDALVRLWHAAAMLYVGLDGLYYSWARKKWGEQLAAELDAEMWRRAAYLDVRRARETMNIHGDDVAALFKVYQCDAGVAGKMDAEYELKNKNHGVLTARRCRSLEYYERHGETMLQKNVCEVIDVQGFRNTARLINPNIRVTPLKLPPRRSKDEIACQWEFKIEE